MKSHTERVSTGESASSSTTIKQTDARVLQSGSAVAFFPMGAIIDRYVIRELLIPWLAGVAAFLSVLLGNFLFKFFEYILNRGIPAGPVVKMLLYQVPGVCVLAVPIATLLAVALVVNRLERESELTAMRSGGVSLLRILVPLTCFAVCMTIVAYTLNETIAPWANHRSMNIVREILLTRPAPLIQEDKFFRLGDDYYFYVRKVDVQQNALEDVLIYERLRQGFVFPRVIIARRAFKSGDTWTLKDCIVHEFDHGGRLVREARADKITFNIGEMIEHFRSEQYEPFEMPAAQLKKQIKVLSQGGIDVRRMQVDLYLKYAVPFACLVLTILAFPLSRRWARAGSFAGILITVLLVFIYQGLMGWSRALGIAGKLSPAVAAWSQNIILTGLGLILLWRER